MKQPTTSTSTANPVAADHRRRASVRCAMALAAALLTVGVLASSASTASASLYLPGTATANCYPAAGTMKMHVEVALNNNTETVYVYAAVVRITDNLTRYSNAGYAVTMYGVAPAWNMRYADLSISNLPPGRYNVYYAF